MYKIVLDPNLFECEDNASEKEQFEHFSFLEKCVEFLANNCDVCLDIYDGAPYAYKNQNYPCPPITKSHYLKIHYNKIRKPLNKIQNRKFSYVDVTDITPCESINNIFFIDDSECKDSFYKYMNYARAFEECIVVLGINNKYSKVEIVIDKSTTKEIEAIWNLPFDCSNRVYKLLIPDQDVLVPFKYKSSCQDLNNAYKSKKIKDISVMQKYGAEFASRNHYVKDNLLSRKNTNYLVFVSDDRNYAISVDQESGGLELFEMTGRGYVHLGQYDYSGNKTKDAQPQNHKLIT